MPFWADQTRPVRTSDDSGRLLDGRYRLLDRLGQGGTAEVYRARDEHLDRDVAVKVFRCLPGGDDTLVTAARREMELQSLARLSHPHLIRLLDGAVGTDGPAYLVLELVPGPDLATRLRRGALPEPDARLVGAQIADALAYAHAEGLVHRDVKPANILLGTDGPGGTVRARLSDFGTVRMIGGARMTAGDLTLGTASYISPEQARGADVGPAADVYSLGLVLIEALTGRRCFDGLPHEVLAARLARTPSIPPRVPRDWRRLLAAMTAAEPARRPGAAEVAARLRRGLDPAAVPVADRAPTVLADGMTHRAGRTGGALLASLAGVAGVALVSGAAFLLVAGSGKPRPDLGPAAPVQAGTPQRTAQSPRVLPQAVDYAPTRPAPAPPHSRSRVPSPKARNSPPARPTASTGPASTAPASAIPPTVVASPTDSPTSVPVTTAAATSASPSPTASASSAEISPSPSPTPSPS